MAKKKNLLPENNYIQNLNPKKKPRYIFNNILHEIKLNEKSIRKGNICPFCNAKNIGTKTNCYNCGRRIKPLFKYSFT